MESKTRPTWYPVKPGDLAFTPVAIMRDNIIVKVVAAHELKPDQIGWLAIDIPEGMVKPMTLSEALGKFQGCSL